MARVYATRADLVTYTNGSSYSVPAEPEATRVLTRASEAVDDALLTAVYDTDPVTDLPTGTAVIAALRDAVCAQVAWWDETGDEQGTAGQYESVSIGSVRLARGSANSAGGTGGQQLGPPAVRHLRLAGLLPGVVTSYW